MWVGEFARSIHTSKIPTVRQPLVSDRLCEMGRYGQKTGAGWYNMTKIAGEPDPEVAAIVQELTEGAGIERRSITPEEIVERTIYALVNEGAKVLEEGFALRAVDIDIIYINRIWLPCLAWRSMWYADTVGLAKVYKRVAEFHAKFGDLWKPAPCWKAWPRPGKRLRSLIKRSNRPKTSAYRPFG
jgi:3-hydroxyacyl-CoA dehydrogenase